MRSNSRAVASRIMTDTKIDYESLAQDALRGVVRTVLARVSLGDQLPGNHHFYISFNTNADGVGISKRLREQYPDEMTVVLQHRYWDLQVHDDRFEVKLTFNSIPERLVVPFTSIKVFFDPSVPYGLQFETAGRAGVETLPPDSLVPQEQPQKRGPTKRPRSQQLKEVPRHGAPPAPAPAPRHALSSIAPVKPAASVADVEKTATTLPARQNKSATEDASPADASAKASGHVVKLDSFRKK